MNPNSNLCSFSQAQAICAELTRRGIGGGVAPIAGKTVAEQITAAREQWDTNGIYIEPWVVVVGSPEPHIGDMLPYMVHFNNGVVNQSIGLMLDKFWRMPRFPENVWDRIALEVSQTAKDMGLS